MASISEAHEASYHNYALTHPRFSMLVIKINALHTHSYTHTHTERQSEEDKKADVNTYTHTANEKQTKVHG